MDSDLRTGIWNLLYDYIFQYVEESLTTKKAGLYPIVKNMWCDFLKLPGDAIPAQPKIVTPNFKTKIFQSDFNIVYDLIEFILESNYPIAQNKFIEDMNKVLEREFAGYRVIDKLVVQIINHIEIESVEKALQDSADNGYKGVNIHLKETLFKLSDRDFPDYRNSFKESLSAIASICQVLTKNQKATLGDAIKELKKYLPIHPAQEKAFSSLYGYASDDDGIRHSLWNESNVDLADAQFMLVSASSFINYLIQKSSIRGNV